MKIQIVNAGAGNLESLRQAFKRLGVPCAEVLKGQDINSSMPIVLPGVGAYGPISNRLWELGIIDRLRGAYAAGQPILGICLGMQLLGNKSDESNESEGLGLIPGHVNRLPESIPEHRVPNIGWHVVSATNYCDKSYVTALDHGTFYHLHSYYLQPEDSASIMATIEFSGRSIPVAVSSGTAVGFQFHPEKSQEDGIELLAAWRDVFVKNGGAVT